MPLSHITSIKSENLIEARKVFIKREYSDTEYKIFGIDYITGEDISMNFPPHITRRIINKGNKSNFKGTLYKYKNDNIRLHKSS